MTTPTGDTERDEVLFWGEMGMGFIIIKFSTYTLIDPVVFWHVTFSFLNKKKKLLYLLQKLAGKPNYCV